MQITASAPIPPQDSPINPADDMQIGGNHYTDMAITPWGIIEAHKLDFFKGNVLKYLLRAGKKDSEGEDLRKAQHYLAKAIELEGANE